jgi:hypothetical protein
VFWMDNSFVHLDAVLSEWSADSDQSKFEILRRLAEHLLQIGGPLEHAFRERSQKNTSFEVRKVVIIAEALCSTIAGTREDAKAELSRLQIAIPPLQDYCRVTSTRLPTIAARRRTVSEHGIPRNAAPPNRDLSPGEIEQARAPWAAAREAIQKRYDSGEFQIGQPIRVMKKVKEQPRARFGIVSARASRPRQAGKRLHEAQPSQVPESEGPDVAVDAEAPQGIAGALAPTSSRDRLQDMHGARPRVSAVRVMDWLKQFHMEDAQRGRFPIRAETEKAARAAFPGQQVDRRMLREARKQLNSDRVKGGRPRLC